jgi:hypothetical protein
MNMPLVDPHEWINDKNHQIHIGDMVDRNTIATRLKVSRQAIGNWAIQRSRTGFPEPIFGNDGVRGRSRGNATCIYYWPDVSSWFEKWQKVKPLGGIKYHKDRS